MEVNEEELSEFLSGIAVAGVRFDEISISKPTLEDYFLKVASRASDGQSATRPGVPPELERWAEAKEGT